MLPTRFSREAKEDAHDIGSRRNEMQPQENNECILINVLVPTNLCDLEMAKSVIKGYFFGTIDFSCSAHFRTAVHPRMRYQAETLGVRPKCHTCIALRSCIRGLFRSTELNTPAGHKVDGSHFWGACGAKDASTCGRTPQRAGDGV